jgi:tetratricopeptide (TPR) repeat protein
MSAPSTGQKQYIVLLTMVKNEEKNIRRLLTSVRGWIDAVVICDTGSTDTTVTLSKSILQEFNLPGKVYEYPWENFGKSRTKSFHCFQEWVNAESGWPAEACWGFLLDADMLLSEESGLHAMLAALPLSCAGVQLPQQNGSLIYKNTRILRASDPWRCVGSTHEYWEPTNGKASQAFETPVLTDIGDGGCKADKFTRDAALLENDLLTDPNNVRTHFYLGQTYMSLGRHEDAIKSLGRRIDLGGWEEEIYISRLYRGDCLITRGRPLEAVAEWLKAWQVRPCRTEAALRLIGHYRGQPNHAFVATIYLEKLFLLQFGETLDGKKVAEPLVNKDILFVNHRDMKYQIWEELGILCFYNGKQAAAQHHLDRLTLDPSFNFNERNRFTELYTWYRWKIPSVNKRPLVVGPEHLAFLKDGLWRGYNPSIRNHGDRYLVCLRYSNYETSDALKYTYRTMDGIVCTRNIIVEYDRNFNVVTDNFTPIEFKIPSKYIINHGTNIHGIEDCRWLNKSSIMGTSRQFTPDGVNKIIRIDFDMKSKALMRMKPLLAPVKAEEDQCQKNWLPFSWNDEECYIYRINPFVVYTMKGKCLIDWVSPKYTFDGLRGSAPPVPWSSAKQPFEYMILVAHFSSYSGEKGRKYYHRFITIGKDLKPLRMSRIFTMADDPIQYVAGMCKSLDQNGYVITYGINDSQAWYMEVKNEVIEESLVYEL